MQPIAVPLTDRINLLEHPTSYCLPDQRRSSNEGAGEVIYYIVSEGQPAFRLLKLKQPRFSPGLKEQRRSSIRPRCASCPVRPEQERCPEIGPRHGHPGQKVPFSLKWARRSCPTPTTWLTSVWKTYRCCFSHVSTLTEAEAEPLSKVEFIVSPVDDPQPINQNTEAAPQVPKSRLKKDKPYADTNPVYHPSLHFRHQNSRRPHRATFNAGTRSTTPFTATVCQNACRRIHCRPGYIDDARQRNSSAY